MLPLKKGINMGPTQEGFAFCVLGYSIKLLRPGYRTLFLPCLILPGIFRSSNLNELLYIWFWYLSENMPKANIIEQNIFWWRVAMFWLIYYKGDLIKFITWRSRYSVYTWNSFSIVSVKTQVLSSWLRFGYSDKLPPTV